MMLSCLFIATALLHNLYTNVILLLSLTQMIVIARGAAVFMSFCVIR
jgi:hypothetical protein